jgi:uroporphyrinogen-III synthase
MNLADLPLRGRTILITRTEEGNLAERKRIEALGGRVVELPLIVIKPPTDSGLIENAIKDLSAFDWIVFTSANGVREFFLKIDNSFPPKRRDIRAKFACVGPGTADALNVQGFTTSAIPDDFLTETLGKKLRDDFELEGTRVLLARAEKANPRIPEILREAGADVMEAPVYRVEYRKIDNVSGLLEELTDITLTSPSTVDALAANFRAGDINSRRIKVHCIGPVTSRRAEELGLEVASVSKVHSIAGLVESICTWLKNSESV